MGLSGKQDVSVYCTVLNEETSVASLLESLISQTLQANEIVFVDGGSTDKTIAIIQEYAKKYGQIRLIVEKGANVAQGRNLAIANTRNDIIVSIDAGCTADRFWLERIVGYFDDNVDIVTGMCLPVGKTLFEVCAGEVLYPTVDAFRADWPSHQNFAFRRYVWEKIKYPERCYRSEDTWFNMRIKENGFKCVLGKDAIVYWRPRSNLREVFKNSYAWAKSNIENDVRTSETKKVAKIGARKLIWNTSGLIVLVFVFLFFSRVGAVLLSPFVLKTMIHIYPGEPSLSKIACKNVIYYTNILAYSLGCRAGQKTKNGLKKE